jgi:hypothetical protein
MFYVFVPSFLMLATGMRWPDPVAVTIPIYYICIMYVCVCMCVYVCVCMYVCVCVCIECGYILHTYTDTLIQYINTIYIYRYTI